MKDRKVIVEKKARNGRKTESICELAKSEKKYLHLCHNFWTKKIWSCSAPQNECLNFGFVKDIKVVVKKMARNGRKTAIRVDGGGFQ